MGPFEWVFNTPSHHRVHHATNAKYLDANYAGVLIIWDRMFGTFRARGRQRERRTMASSASSAPSIRSASRSMNGPASAAMSRSAKIAARGAVAIVFGPPGWSPDGSRKTSARSKRDWASASQSAPAVPSAIEAE